MLKILQSLIASRESAVFQLGAWGLAVALAITLMNSVRELSRAEALKADLAVPSIDVKTVPLRRDDYLAVRERVGRSYADSGVKFNAAEDSLTIRAAKLEDYTSWRLAVSDVMLSMPGAVWSVKNLCAGEKCADGAFSATVTAMVRNFAVGTSSNALAAPDAGRAGPVGAAAR